MNSETINSVRPFLGFGLGLRVQHYKSILAQQPKIDWFEILTENYLVPGGKPLHYLDQVRQLYPVVMHGVSLSIGSTDPLDFEYLAAVKQLMQRIQPQWVSDHLCWTGVNGKNMHDLLPLPYTEEAIDHVVARVSQVQDFLGQRILLENVSSYITYQHSTLSEWEFFTAIAERADCLMLLDVNNVYVSAVNHEFNPHHYLDHLPLNRVYQIHLAGHSDYGDYMIDTHDADIIKNVWDLYAYTLRRFGAVSTMIERDDNIPELADMLIELEQARTIAADALSKQAITL